MKIINAHDEAKTNFKNLYVSACIGNFDGVHKGHQELIAKTVKSAKENDGISIAITFNHNTKILNNERKFLTTLYEKTSIIETLGIDYVYLIDFPDGISELSSYEFTKKYLVDTLRIKEIYIGENFRFGHKRSGTPDNLVEFGKSFGFKTHILKLVTLSGMVVSSTIARTAVNEGRVDICKNLLGYPYFLRGVIGKGKSRGKKYVFPTANLYNLDELKLIPGEGVYSTITIIDGSEYFSLTNIGPQPTFQDEKVSIESYILNFQREIYGKEIALLFLRKLRNIIQFANSDELKKQIETDKSEAVKDFELFIKNPQMELLSWLK
ncbi:MAG TPA: bifunctional riboflavin kinase/FAD synthetase [Caldisericia bacterium]|nr:bifunctional riboflavin kinase/FAD synthetase [Caldisericia bacterium]